MKHIQTHPIKIWLKLEGRSQPWLARQIGIHPVTLSNYLRKGMPRTTALAVEAVTQGAVKAADIEAVAA